MTDLDTLFSALEKADKANNVEDATEIARMIRSVQSKERNSTQKDSSLATGMEHSFEKMQQGSLGYVGDVASSVDKSGFGQAVYGAQNLFNDKVYNPVARFFGGEERNVAGEDEKTTGQLKSDELINKAQKKSDEAGERADALNYETMTTDDVKSVGDAFRFAIVKGAESLPYMTASPLLLAGTIMPGEVNESLKEIEGLPEKERLALAASGGAIMGLLERFGAKQVFKGIDPRIIGRMGIQGTMNHLKKKGLTSLVASITKAAAAEGITEFGQENTKMAAEAIGGKDITQEEWMSRSKEAFWGGVGGGASISSGGKVVAGTATVSSRLFNDANMSQSDRVINGRIADRMETIAKTEKLNPKVVGNKDSDAFKIYNMTRKQIVAEIKQLRNEKSGDKNEAGAAKIINEIINSDADLKQAVDDSKNKSENYIRSEQFLALNNALGDSQEGQKLLQLVEESANLASFYNANNGDLKGGISQYTDQVNPFNKGTGIQNITRIGTGGLLVAGGALGGAPTLGAAAGTFVGGRGIDMVTGRRSRVARFMAKNRRGKAPVGDAISGRSLKAEFENNSKIEQIKREVAEIQNRQAANRATVEKENERIAKETQRTEEGVRKFQFGMIGRQMKDVLGKAKKAQEPVTVKSLNKMTNKELQSIDDQQIKNMNTVEYMVYQKLLTDAIQGNLAQGNDTSFETPVITPKNDSERAALTATVVEIAANKKLAIEQRENGAAPKLRTGGGRQDAASPEGSVFEALGHTVLNNTTGRHELIDKAPDASIRIRAKIQQYLAAAKANPNNQSIEAQRALEIYELNVANQQEVFDKTNDGKKVPILSDIITMLQTEKGIADFNEANMEQAALLQTPPIAQMEADNSTSPALISQPQGQGDLFATLEAENSQSPAALSTTEVADAAIQSDAGIILTIDKEDSPQKNGVENIEQAQRINDVVNQTIINNSIVANSSDTPATTAVRKTIENKSAQGTALPAYQTVFSMLPKAALANKNHPIRKELTQFKTKFNNEVKNNPKYATLAMPESGQVTPLWLYIINPSLLGKIAPKSKSMIKRTLPKLI